MLGMSLLVLLTEILIAICFGMRHRRKTKLEAAEDGVPEADMDTQLDGY